MKRLTNLFVNPPLIGVVIQWALEENSMSQEIKAVFENGVFRPLEPVELKEHQEVSVQIPETKEALGSGDVPEDEEAEIDPVWRGVFPSNREAEVIFEKDLDITVDQLPQRPFTVDLDWDRITDDE